jgi:hypothetical protein
MSRPRKGAGRSKKLAAPLRELAEGPEEVAFQAVLALIQGAQRRVWHAANLELVELYWRIGEHISQRVAGQGWGRGTVQRLADWLSSRELGLSGFSASNLWRMRQFFETYATDKVNFRGRPTCSSWPGARRRRSARSTCGSPRSNAGRAGSSNARSRGRSSSGP